VCFAGLRVGRRIWTGSTKYKSPLPKISNLETNVFQVQLKKQYCESYFKATAPLLIQSERKLQVKDFDLKDLLTEMQRNWNILHYLMRCLCLKSIS
jgi:hypothetical protein